MKKKIALLLVLVLSLSFVLASCGECAEHVDEDVNGICDKCEAEVPIPEPDPEYLGFEGYYVTDYKESWAPAAAATKIDEIKDCSLYGVYNNLAVYRNYSAEKDEIKYAVLNLDTGKVVYTLKMEADDAVVTKSAYVTSSYGPAIIEETQIDETNEFAPVYTTTYYTALGEKIASATSKQGSGSVEFVDSETLIFDGKVYSIKDDVATYLFDKGFIDFEDIDVDAKTDKYIYDVETSYEDAVYIYDLKYQLVDVYYAPYDAENSIYILDNGNILVQSQYQLLDEATEYDFEIGVEKYNYTTKIYDVETKTATEIEYEYIVYDLMNATIYEEYNDVFVEGKIPNLAYLIKVEDKKVEFNRGAYIVASLDNDLKILGYACQEIPNQYGIPTLIADNRFIVRNLAGQEFLLNEKGVVLGEVTDAEEMPYEAYEGLFVDNSTMKLYDASLQVIADMSSVPYEYMDNTDSYSVLTYEYEVPKEGGAEGETEDRIEIYVFCRKGFVKLDLPADPAMIVDFEIDYESEIGYVTYKVVAPDETVTYKSVFFNQVGEKVFEYTSSVTTVEGVTTTTGVYDADSVGDCLIITVRTDVDNGSEVTTTYEYYCIANK